MKQKHTLTEHPAMIQTNTEIVLVFSNGDSYTAEASHPNYGNILKAVADKDWQLFVDLIEPARLVERKLAGGHVTIHGGIVMLRGKPLHTTLTKRMLTMIDNDINVEPLARFAVRLYKNPSKRAIKELYGFLENSKLPITEDGYFLAYRRIRVDWKDIHSGTMDNTIGATVKMKREDVTKDKNTTCAPGLHFCALSYLKMYGSWNNTEYRTVVVKINPKDVVSIPKDYNNAKGRCCKFKVLSELNEESRLEGLTNTEYKHMETPEDANEMTPTEDVVTFCKSRTAMQTYVKNHPGTKRKDFGINSPKGRRWGVINK